MIRDRVRKVLLMVVGGLFVATVYPGAMILWQRSTQQYTDAMMLSIYVTLGIFLLLASRNPLAHRSLITFAGWSSLAHSSTMAVMALTNIRDRTDLLMGVGGFATVGVILLTATPRKASNLGPKETAA